MDEKPSLGSLSRPRLSLVRKPAGESVIRTILGASTIVSALTVFVILAFLIYFSLPLFLEGNPSAIFFGSWQPLQGRFGIFPMIAGSSALAFCALLLSYPLGLGICLFAHGLGPAIIARPILVLIHFMTGIPTVVYGFVAAMALVPFLREGFPFSSGFSLLAAALTLAVLILPTIVLLINSRLRQVVAVIRPTSTALGIHPAGELIWISLPAASRGLTAAAVLGFGRAIGDTLIALMVAGNAAQIPNSLLDSIRTLTAHIALVVATDNRSPAFQSLFACGMILFLITAGVNFALHRINRLNTGERSKNNG